MASKYSVPLRTIVEENGLEPLHTSSDYDTRLLTVADVNRPALQLAGFYNYFDPNRLQIIGRVESTYLELKTEAERRSCFEELMRYDISALVICHGASAFPECLEVAGKYDRNLFVTPEDTSDFMADVISSLHTHLAPRTTMHGVLVEVHGEGVLLTGDSGIGKSETALELIKRGHKLIADDAVDIRRIGRDRLVGTAPELIRYYMELRGIGVVDVRHLYGVGAVKPGGRDRPRCEPRGLGRSEGVRPPWPYKRNAGYPRCDGAELDDPGASRQEPCRYPRACGNEQPPEEDGLQRRGNSRVKRRSRR